MIQKFLDSVLDFLPPRGYLKIIPSRGIMKIFLLEHVR